MKWAKADVSELEIKKVFLVEYTPSILSAIENRDFVIKFDTQ